MGSALVLATVPALLVAGLIAALYMPVNLQLTVTDTALVLEPRGTDVLWTRQRCIEIPLAQVADVRVIPRAEAPPRGPRRGLELPAFIAAGSYGTDSFWDVRRGDQVLMITCHPGAAYQVLVLEFTDPYATLARTRTVLAPIAT